MAQGRYLTRQFSEGLQTSVPLPAPVVSSEHYPYNAELFHSFFQETTPNPPSPKSGILPRQPYVLDFCSPRIEASDSQHSADCIGSSTTTSSVSEKSLSRGPRPTFEEERLKRMTSEARKAGYHDLDSALCGYYTAILPSGSMLSVEQRLSRNRRLPKIVASLSWNAQMWSPWERRGFQEELVRSAETVLIHECRSFQRHSCYERWHKAWRDTEELSEDAFGVFHEQVRFKHSLSLDSLSLYDCD